MYRGLGGMLLPKAFHDKNELGCMGGVERAFMSTTTKREIAVQYSGKKTPTIFQISIGQIDMGASLNVLSQYAGEEEILMPPLSNLEVVGPKWYENGCMVVPLRINVNLKSSTIDEIVKRRKLLHKNMLGNLISEAKRVLDDVSENRGLVAGSVSQRIVKQAGEILDQEYKDLRDTHEAFSADDFNVDSVYKKLIVEGVEEKGRVLSLHSAVYFRILLLLRAASPADGVVVNAYHEGVDKPLGQTVLTCEQVLICLPYMSALHVCLTCLPGRRS